MNHLLLMMGGSGVRFGNQIPKHYIKINGCSIYMHILKKICMIDDLDTIILVVNENWIEYVKNEIFEEKVRRQIVFTVGGQTRSESVLNGLKKLSEFAKDDDVVLIYDTTHPYVSEIDIKRVIDATLQCGAATLGMRQYDTCYKIENDNVICNVIPRQNIVTGASPEGFIFKTIYNIFVNATKKELDNMTSAGAMALAYNIKMRVVPTDILNLKITHVNDMEIFKALIGKCKGF